MCDGPAEVQCMYDEYVIADNKLPQYSQTQSDTRRFLLLQLQSKTAVASWTRGSFLVMPHNKYSSTAEVTPTSGSRNKIALQWLPFYEALRPHIILGGGDTHQGHAALLNKCQAMA